MLDCPLHWAAKAGKAGIEYTFSMARVLLDADADVSEATLQGKTPLHMAAEFGRREAARVLLGECLHRKTSAN